MPEMSRFVQQALVCEGPSVTRQPSPCASHGLMVRRLRSSQEAQLDVDSYTQMQSLSITSGARTCTAYQAV